MLLTESFLNIISDFGADWVVKRIETDVKSKSVYVDLEYNSDKYWDPITEVEAKLYDHSEQRIWRHLDIWDYQSYIRCRLPRVKCADGKVRVIKTGWCGKYDRHTYSFEIKVIDTLKATKNQTKTAGLLHCSFGLVNKIIHNSTERGLERRALKSLPIGDMSIDEKSFKKGHEYVTVLSHPSSGCVLDVGAHRDTASVEKLLQTAFSSEQLAGIKTVGLDMWKPYIKAVSRLIPSAEMVHDRFHLISYLNKAIDKIRRREVKENELLKNSRYALLKNAENRTDKQQALFDDIIRANLEVSKAHHAKETFRSLFDLANNDKAAKDYLIRWAEKFFMHDIKELNKVIMQLLSHSKGVINALISKINNAMAERLNGKIQELKISARGYRKFENFRSAILFFHGGLDLFPLKWQ